MAHQQAAAYDVALFQIHSIEAIATEEKKRGGESPPKNNGYGSRLLELDVLRFLAVSLVVIAHISHLDLTERQRTEIVAMTRFVEAGWIGVPIFFVLSGFLISHILIKEFRETGQISVKRFFVRRGFKIYPVFYLCIFSYSAALFVMDGSVDPVRFLREIFFLQNYGRGGLIEVTWSLAVEEHFYILFPLLLVYLIRRSRKVRHMPDAAGGGDSRVVRPILWVTTILVVLCWILRIDAQSRFPDGGLLQTSFPTHLRIDALFVGASLGYFYNFHRADTLKWFSRFAHPVLFFATTVFFLALSSIDSFVTRFSLTHYPVLLSAGAVGLLGVALARPLPQLAILRFFGMIGQASYSIYLFHVPFIRLVGKMNIGLFGGEFPIWGLLLIAMTGAFVVGIAVSRLIEWPVLAIRDRFFPSFVRIYFEPRARKA